MKPLELEQDAMAGLSASGGSVANVHFSSATAPPGGSVRPCSVKAKKHLPWAIAELDKMAAEETDPKLKALWRNAAQLGREAQAPNSRAMRSGEQGAT